MRPVAKASEKYTAPRIEDLARRAARSENNDDWTELKEANASLMDARDGDMGRLVARLLDTEVILTFEEREFLAVLRGAKAKAATRLEEVVTRDGKVHRVVVPIPSWTPPIKAARPKHRPTQDRVQIRRDLAARFFAAAKQELAKKARGEPARDVIGDGEPKPLVDKAMKLFGLSRTVAYEIHKQVNSSG
jgi:hypothetical protein